MSRTDITLHENAEIGHLEAITEDGRVAGFVEYERTDEGDFVAVHTEVDPDFEGHGVGSLLAAGVVDLVRSSGRRLRPDCPFIASWLREHPEAHDVVVEGVTF